jgi:predicted Zn-dependent protease
MGSGLVWRPTPEVESEARLMLDQVTRALRKQDGVDDWLVKHIGKTSTQYYVIGSRPESRRQVSSEQMVATIMNDHPSASGGGDRARGEAQVTLLPADLPHLSEKLSQAVFMASLADNPCYGLPGPAEYPIVTLADTDTQAAPSEVAEHMIQQLTEALQDEQAVRLSSAEVFIEQEQITLQNSHGAQGSRVQTDILLDFVLLSSSAEDEMESHIALRRRRAADLDIPAFAHRQAQYARDALTAGTPSTGAYPVVVSDEALAELLGSAGYSPLILRSSAQLKYQRMTTWEAGESVLPQEASGDPFTMYSNALLPFGNRSGSFDADGLAGQRITIIENGILSRFWATSRYAQYLQIAATGDFGNMEIVSGSVPFANLFDGGPLYHIVAFSAMSPDPFTGDFVGEIRLGYEIEEGRKRPIRGGSISGNLLAGLAAARLSKETVFLGDYLGPRGIRFAEVTIAGA